MEMVVFRISARSSLYIQERCVSDTKSSIQSCYIPDANVEHLGTKPFLDCSKPGLIAVSEKPSSKICSVRCQRLSETFSYNCWLSFFSNFLCPTLMARKKHLSLRIFTCYYSRKFITYFAENN